MQIFFFTFTNKNKLTVHTQIVGKREKYQWRERKNREKHILRTPKEKTIFYILFHNNQWNPKRKKNQRKKEKIVMNWVTSFWFFLANSYRKMTPNKKKILPTPFSFFSNHQKLSKSANQLDQPASPVIPCSDRQAVGDNINGMPDLAGRNHRH